MSNKKKHKLKAFWSKKENDVMIEFAMGIGTKGDGGFLAGIFNERFTNELKERGYDINTLKFEIVVNAESRPEKFATILSEKK